MCSISSVTALAGASARPHSTCYVVAGRLVGHSSSEIKAQQWGDGSVAGDTGVVPGEKARLSVFLSVCLRSLSEADASVGWRRREGTGVGGGPRSAEKGPAHFACY